MSIRRQREDYGGSVPENYERYFVPVLGAPLASHLVEIASLRPGERVLDVACGTGIAARLASQSVGAAGTVTGLDVDPDMLAVARSATPTGTTIHWHEANAEAMPFADASFDAVLCQMGLQFVPDKHAVLREMRRVLAPGGRLILNVPGPTPQLFIVMGEALARQFGGEVKGFVNRVFSLHDTVEIHDLIDGAGFRDVAVRANSESLQLPAPAEFLWQYVHSTPLAGLLADMDDGRHELLERDVVEGWQEYVKDGALELQVRMVVGTARK